MEADIQGIPSYKASERAFDEALKIKSALEKLV
jgi:hypothetical protein